MRKSRFTEEQIAYAIRQVEHGTPAIELCRKMGISEQTFYTWKKKYAVMGLTELRRVKQLEDENRELKGLVAALTSAALTARIFSDTQGRLVALQDKEWPCP